MASALLLHRCGVVCLGLGLGCLVLAASVGVRVIGCCQEDTCIACLVMIANVGLLRWGVVCIRTRVPSVPEHQDMPLWDTSRVSGCQLCLSKACLCKACWPAIASHVGVSTKACSSRFYAWVTEMGLVVWCYCSTHAPCWLGLLWAEYRMARGGSCCCIDCVSCSPFCSAPW